MNKLSAMRSHRALLILTSLLLMLGLPTTAEAQVSARPHLHIGVGRILPLQDAGAGFLGVSDRSMPLGFTGGVGVTITRSGWVSAEADLLFERVHLVEDWYSDLRTSGWRERTQASYLHIPITALVRPLENGSVSPFLNAGPFLAIKLSESEEFTPIENGKSSRYESEGPAWSRTTYGMVVGVGASIEIGSYDVRADIRYARGMGDSYVHVFHEASVHTAMVTLGVAL